MVKNVFRESRRNLTLFYSLNMAVFLILLIFAVHGLMKWAVISEQKDELMDMASDTARTQEFFLQHKEYRYTDEFDSDSGRDRLFFYVFSNDGKVLNSSRASKKLEPFVRNVIETEKISEDDVSVVTKRNDDGEPVLKVMMTARPVMVNGAKVGMVYVGKENTAMFNGLQKATYLVAAVAVLALIAATLLGYFMAGWAMIPLHKAYEKQRQFAADASHELRTPLSVLMASADLLDNDSSITSPFLKQVISDVRDEVRKMTKLVSELLLVARNDNEVSQLKFVQFDITVVAEQIIRMMQPLADKKQINLHLEGSTEQFVCADEEKIKQLLLILVDNAVKYTNPGGSVLVNIKPNEKGRVSFAVSDTGIGIERENIEKIFDRFYRVDKTRSREIGGNGLGLAIAREIVNLHNGKIKVDSELGKGTTFLVELKNI